MSLGSLIEICKSYQTAAGVKVEALKNVNLDIESGDHIAIMGSSGSGKSTLLNIMGCLDHPTEGSYILDGEDMLLSSDDARSSIRSLRIGFIFQSFNLISYLTVAENIEVPLFYQGVEKKKRRQAAIRLARRVGLEQRINHRPAELSGGQQQRVAIARALVNDPVLILADEPTGNLDKRTGFEILDILDELVERGKTLVIVTHDEAIGSRAKHIVQMDDGILSRIK